MIKKNVSLSKSVNIKAQFLLMGFDSEIDEIILDSHFRIYKGSEIEVAQFYEDHNIPSKGIKRAFFCEYLCEVKGLNSNTEHLDYPWFLLEVFFSLILNTHVKFPFVNHFVYDDKLNEYSSIERIRKNKMSEHIKSNYHLNKTDLDDVLNVWYRLNENRVVNDKALLVVFRRAIFATQKYNYEDVLIDLMIAFEALFLNENGELNYRLSLRVSSLLSNSWNKSEVFNFVKKTYNLRSKIVHGKVVKLKDFGFETNSVKNGLFKTNKTLIEILKDAMKIYVLESDVKSVSEFIQVIDDKIIGE